MYYITKFKSFLLLAIFSLFFIAACIKGANYAPINDLKTIDSIISIKTLRKMHALGEMEFIKQPYSIIGKVVANDESNNLYKSICIQDSTGGIILLLDGVALYQNFPVGASLKIRVQNLLLTDYRRMYQLGAGVDSVEGRSTILGIPQPLFFQHITVLNEMSAIEPIPVTYRNLTDSLQGRLIRLVNVEFAAADTNLSYADKKNKIGASRALKFCTGGTIYLRTSGYANFAGVKLPSGNGYIDGVYSVYNAEKQLFIRDTNDIMLINKRCTGAAWLKNE